VKDLIDLLLSLFSKSPKKDLDSYLKENEKTKNEIEEKPQIKPIEFKNDSQRLKKEFLDLVKLNLPLRSILEDLNIFVNLEFDKNLVITMINRTQEEQDRIYKDNAKYKKKKFKSPHQFLHATDIRSRTFTSEEVTKIENYLNTKWNSSNYYRWTAKNHTVGLGLHFHIQYFKV